MRLADRLALRLDEAAEALGISEGTLRNHIAELPVVRFGKAITIPVDALRQWLLAKVETSKSEVASIADEILASLDDDSD